MSQIYGAGCLLIAAVLVVGQIYALLLSATQKTVKAATEQAVEAASKAADAAAAAKEASEAANSVATAAAQDADSFGQEGLTDQVRAQLRSKSAAAIRMQARTATEKADEAGTKAKEAEDAASKSTGINDVLVSISAKAPLGVLGFLFAVLGALAAGLIDFSAAATAR